ncbi:MAG: hypothetical protein M3Y84_02455 [Acidobacteriota bacterium]|nr:hypothetical protein [Acidobacteriota bacterium]
MERLLALRRKDRPKRCLPETGGKVNELTYLCPIESMSVHLVEAVSIREGTLSPSSDLCADLEIDRLIRDNGPAQLVSLFLFRKISFETSYVSVA